MTPELTQIDQRILELIRQFVASLGSDRAVRGIAIDADLDRSLGLGSLERVELLLQIEKAFSVRLPDNLITQARTPRDIASAVLRAEPPRQCLTLEPLPFIGEAGPPPTFAPTMVEVLLTHAKNVPDRPHIYLSQDDGKEQVITYRQLLDASRAVARGLLERGLSPRETVGIMLPTEAGFFFAFFGVLLAGGIPVPLYPPFRIDQIEEFTQRQAAILRKAEVRFLVISKPVEGLARLIRPFVPKLSGVISVDRLHASSDGQIYPTCKREDAALIQFTSGSTSEPKGVLLSHENILANIRAFGQAAEIRSKDVGVSWLPLYHDMGLIASWLCSLYFGIPITILSPLTFLSRPERWLWAIHYHRATLSAAPNFAYELCVRKIDDRAIEGIDLSSWRIAFNGAEPVNPDTLSRFIKRFGPYGFRKETLLPVYGLAECSVALSFPPLGSPPRIDKILREPFERHRVAEPASASESSPLRFVSCGVPIPGHAIRIVDEAGSEVGERTEGYLQFQGPSAMQGYFNDSRATQSVLFDGWYDSGDLAYRAEGHLFITGRRKDLIIKAGRNLYPQEVEETAGEIDGIRKGCVITFGTSDPETGTESLVVIAETRGEPDKVRKRLTSEVMERVAVVTGIRPDVVLIVPQGGVPKTSSGKLRRAAAKENYLRGKKMRRRAAPWIQITKLWLGGVLSRVQRGGDTLGRVIYTAYIGILLFLTVFPTWLALLALPGGKISARLSRQWARVFLLLSGCRLSLEGNPSPLSLGPMVLVANHSSYLDAVVLMAALPPSFVFMAKQELLRAPVIRTAIKKVGHLTVDRLDFAKSVREVQGIEKELQTGRSVLIFPEGTFSRTRGLRPFRLGAFKMAAETSTPICPIAIQGTREILSPGSRLPRRGPIKVVIAAPIFPTGADWQEVLRLRNVTKAEIAHHSGEMPLDLVEASIPSE